MGEGPQAPSGPVTDPLKPRRQQADIPPVGVCPWRKDEP